MRELQAFELDQVEGGNPLLLAVAIGAGVIAVGGLAVIAYGISEGCSGSMEVSKDGIKLSVTCPA